MNPNVVNTIVVGFFTLVASLGGVLLTQRHQERRDREARRAADRDEVRALLTRLAHVGNEWAELLQAVLPGYAKFEATDLFEFVESDSGKRLGDLRRELSARFGEAVLRIGDDAIRDPLSRAFTLYNESGEKCIGLVAPRRDRPTGDALFELVAASLRYVRDFRLAIVDLQVAAAPLVRVKIGN